MTGRIKLDRQIVVETAAEIADQAGLEQVTLAALAIRLGIRKPSLYNHVDGLPALRKQLAIWGTCQLRGIISEAAVGKARGEAILAVAEAYREFAQQRPGLYRAIVSSPDRSDQELKVAIKGMMAVLYTVLSAYNLVDSDATHAARALRSLMHGFVSLEAAEWFAAPVDRDESYRRLVETFIRGLETLA